MLAGGTAGRYRDALATSHERYSLVEVLDGSMDGTVLEPDLLFVQGTVSASLNSRVARQLTLTVPETLYPFQAGDLLAPYGNILRCWRGVRYADGSRDRWPVFYGRIQTSRATGRGLVTVQAADLGADVVEAKFFDPESSIVTNTLEQEIRRLIRGAIPAARFGAFDTFTVPVQALTWQLDRAQALDELTTSAGAFWYALADGEFVARVYPWTVPGSPVVTYSDAGSQGIISESFPSRARADVFNSVTVTGERLNGQPAVYATEQDNNPSSPTFIGSFGARHRLVRLQTPSSFQAAQNAAQLNLRRLTALVQSWSWSMVPDAALELGDVALVAARGVQEVQVVTGFSLPLADGEMTVAARSQVLPALEGVAG